MAAQARRVVFALILGLAAQPAGGASEGCAARIKSNHMSGLCQSRRKRHAETHQERVVDGWVDSYDRLTRPALATKMAALGDDRIQGKHVDHENISVGLFVNQVWDIDQRAGSFKVQAQLRLLWQDDRLCFDGSNLHHPRINLDEQSMQNLTTGVSILESLWLPDVHFHNSIHSGTEEQPDAQLLRVSECGEVLWARRFIVTLWVDFRFQQLPFDSQRLNLELESYRMPVDDVVLKWTGGCDHGSDYTGVADQSNPEWKFTDTAAEDTRCNTSVITHLAPGSNERFSRAVMSIEVQRQEAMWITSYINPSWTLLLISYLGLFIGNHNPGRPGVHAITILAHLTIDSSIRAQVCNPASSYLPQLLAVACISFLRASAAALVVDLSLTLTLTLCVCVCACACGAHSFLRLRIPHGSPTFRQVSFTSTWQFLSSTASATMPIARRRRSRRTWSSNATRF